MQEYFDFKGLADDPGRDLEHFTRMVRDEGIRIARKLIATGLDPQIPSFLSGAIRFFESPVELHGTFPLELLAGAEAVQGSERGAFRRALAQLWRRRK